MRNSWVYRLGAGGVLGLRCASGFRPECHCHTGGIGHETRVVRKEKYRGVWFLGIRYFDEDEGKHESNFLPVKYLKDYATWDYTSISRGTPFPLRP